MSISIPQGFRYAGVHAGIKSDPGKEDVTLVVSDGPATAAGVYTQNLVCAPPVVLDRQRTPTDQLRAVVVNSGNANACTGEQGLKDAREMCHLAAAACSADEQQALVMSTGIIGHFLPMDKIARGIAEAARSLGVDEAAYLHAARGIMTTDAHEKIASTTLTLGDVEVRIAGMAKGAGMIGPNMATMLGLVTTDAALDPQDAQKLLQAVADQSFNCISVEGHTSTNDTLLLVANGAAGGTRLQGASLSQFQESLTEMCIELARKIPDDGEGSSHLVTILVNGCESVSDARQIAKTVAGSALVKTAVAGADPNWGRIVSAAGYAGIPFDPNRVSLYVNDILLFANGTPQPFDAAAASASMRSQRETRILLQFGDGQASATHWTSDLTTDYVKFNSDYHT